MAISTHLQSETERRSTEEEYKVQVTFLHLWAGGNVNFETNDLQGFSNYSFILYLKIKEYTRLSFTN